MASNRKYAALPDLDSAPDIYETPELTDDHSTLPTTSATARSTSPDSLDKDGIEDDQDPNASISRQHLHLKQARSYFSPARVDAEGVDFSDRISGKRRSYRTSSRRRRRRDRSQAQEKGEGEISDEEDDEDEDDDEEGLQRRIARLRREVEEVKEEVKRRRMEKDEGEGKEGIVVDDKIDDQDGVGGLSRILDELRTSDDGAGKSAEEQLLSALEKKVVAALPHPSASNEQAHSSSSTMRSMYPLSKITASFDTRLTLLERVLGISSSSYSLSDDAPHRPIIPTLETLYGQIASLASLSPATLDALSRRIRQLTQDAAKLIEARSTRPRSSSASSASSSASAAATSAAPKPDHHHHHQSTTIPAEVGNTAKVTDKPAAATTQSTHTTADSGGSSSISNSSSSRTKSQIRALYRTLPTLERLSPLLPPLLDRLQSLRGIHVNAARASQALDGVERAQEETQKEISRWREGLEKLEGKMMQGEDVLKANVQVVETWVRELEERISKLDVR